MYSSAGGVAKTSYLQVMTNLWLLYSSFILSFEESQSVETLWSLETERLGSSTLVYNDNQINGIYSVVLKTRTVRCFQHEILQAAKEGTGEWLKSKRDAEYGEKVLCQIAGG